MSPSHLFPIGNLLNLAILRKSSFFAMQPFLSSVNICGCDLEMYTRFARATLGSAFPQKLKSCLPSRSLSIPERPRNLYCLLFPTHRILYFRFPTPRILYRLFLNPAMSFSFIIQGSLLPIPLKLYFLLPNI